MSQIPKVAIIGGGLSGLSHSLLLTQQGIAHCLYESSPILGGRAREIFQRDGIFLDNGQHMISSRYSATKKILNLVNPYWRNDCHHFYPWHIKTSNGKPYLLGGCENSLNLREIFSLIPFIFNPKSLERADCDQSLYNKFLLPFCLSVFALPPSKVPLEILRLSLRQFFISPKLYLPLVSLSELIINPLERYLKQHGLSQIHLSEPLLKIESLQNGKSQLTFKKTQCIYDKVIFALPPTSLQKVFPFLPTVNQKVISTLYLKNEHKTKGVEVMISPVSGAEWKITTENKITYISSGDRKSKLCEQNHFTEPALKEVTMKRAVTDISCPNLPLLKKKITRLPYLFLGDWNHDFWPCTLEAATSTGLKYSS